MKAPHLNVSLSFSSHQWGLDKDYVSWPVSSVKGEKYDVWYLRLQVGPFDLLVNNERY